jgi:hypothetical protein
MDSHTLVTQTSHLIFTRLDDDLLALDGQAGRCYSLNRYAAAVWELLESPIAVGALCGRLTEQFDVDDRTCCSDVRELLIELRDAGLVELDGTIS